MVSLKQRIHNIHFRIRNAKFLFKHKEINRPCVIRNPEYISVGKNVSIKKYSRLECWDSIEGNELRPNLIISDGVHVGFGFTCMVTDTVTIGKDSMLAANVMITSSNHGMDPECGVPYLYQPVTSKPVHIGENCWIGEKVVILPGIAIGDNSIIAASSVVVKDVPAYSIAAGNPAKVIKKYDFDSHEWVKVT